MALNGIDAVVFGVADMAEAERFLNDWGVEKVSATSDKLVYRTRDGAEVIVRPKDATDLPPAIEPGNTVREVIWGSANAAELERTLGTLKTVSGFAVGADGLPRVADPNGLSLAFRVSKRRLVVKPTPQNAPGTHQRVDRARRSTPRPTRSISAMWCCSAPTSRRCGLSTPKNLAS